MNRPPGWPPMEPPPGGGQPYGGRPPGDPNLSRLSPPWRFAAPGERGPVVLWTIAGFVVPWVLLVLGIALAILGHPLPTVILVAAALLLDVAGFVVMLVANRLRIRGVAYGSFAGCLTHIVSVALAVVVFFGWCVSSLNGT